nr:RNA-directed DNA polymerase, eukaryota, reverse transcriptase zinc-binding domain protein [Tanacetum cinerariifolium]
NKLWTFIKVPSPSFVVDERVIWIEVSGFPLFKESALKDSKEGDQANVSTHVAGDNETLFSGKVKEEYFVTKEDKPSKENVSDTSKPPGFENFIKENSDALYLPMLQDQGDQANVSTYVAGDNETLFSKKVKEEYFVTKEDKPSEEDVSDASEPPGFENFIKEISECSISSNASRSGKCSTSFGNYKRKELKGFSFIDKMSQMIKVGGTLGYDVKGCKKSLWKMINGIGMSMADK